ncbi:hypothetical protein EDD75_1367 [Thermodesulfitimonas autotrophica]|uniref:Uncharacterized protein n=1 Tax=Thermodesulfitimonas autotrophica TaxID=1894989 RepID=A0A3N5BMX2_9THEO|nr:hypothetical protein [Thermodesulfitimonas autotrophica]RPF47095.1 hypothetical protein EDD75_1367 [Thermodesulfitimonas autotrophica]
MEFEAAVGSMSRGFLTFSLTAERIRVYWVWGNREVCPYCRREKVVQDLLYREITSTEEKRKVAEFLAQMVAWLRDTDERDFYRTLRQRGTSWSVMVWADRVCLWARGEDIYPPWWDDVWASIREFTGDFSDAVVPGR